MTKPEIQALINKSLAEFLISITQVISETAASAAQEAKNYSDEKDVIQTAYLEEYARDQAASAQYMIDPFTGEMTDIRVIMSEIISAFIATDTLTATEFDALEYTASAFDATQITAYEFDFSGKTILS